MYLLILYLIVDEFNQNSWLGNTNSDKPAQNMHHTKMNINMQLQYKIGIINIVECTWKREGIIRVRDEEIVRLMKNNLPPYQSDILYYA